MEVGVHDPVHFVVHDVAGSPEVNWVYNFIIAILFIAIQVLCLASVSCITLAMQYNDPTNEPTRVMEKQRIIRLRILHQPVHSP